MRYNLPILNFNSLCVLNCSWELWPIRTCGANDMWYVVFWW